ncbi:MAG TPA: hypothetical protein VFT40_01760 [Sphingomicrobium sp.]|nr:hypothetical protein [Sphingomicrobium sp.]
MDIISPAIRRAVEIAVLEGNSVASTSEGFSKRRQVVFMQQPLSIGAHSAIGRELPQLRPYRSEQTPHNPADEGFVDDEADVAVSFPMAGEASRWA